MFLGIEPGRMGEGSVFSTTQATNHAPTRELVDGQLSKRRVGGFLTTRDKLLKEVVTT